MRIGFDLCQRGESAEPAFGDLDSCPGFAINKPQYLRQSTPGLRF